MRREDREWLRRGDFIVEEEAYEEAEEAFSERSKASRRRDKALRGPIVDDVDYWRRNQRIVDFPGIDTPTDRPRRGVSDFPTPEGRARMDEGDDVRIEPNERKQSTTEVISESFYRWDEQSRRITRAARDII